MFTKSKTLIKVAGAKEVTTKAIHSTISKPPSLNPNPIQYTNPIQHEAIQNTM